MDSAHIQEFLHKLGCTHIKAGDSWVYSSCPLAPYTHAKGRDAHPSFSVAISATRSGAHCHACNFKGNLVGLLWRLQAKSRRDLGAVASFVQKHDGHSLERLRTGLEARALKHAVALSPDSGKADGPSGTQLTLTSETSKASVFSEETLQGFLPLEHPRSKRALDYLEERRFSLEALKRWDVCWNPKHGRIVIPIREYGGRLVGYSGRACREGMRPKYLHAKGFKRDLYLYGEHLLTEGSAGVGLLVEGFFDVMRLRSYGYQAVAVMGSHLSISQLEKLVWLFRRIVIIPDGDKPGRDAALEWETQLRKRVSCRVVSMEDGKDPDDLTFLEVAQRVPEVSV
jgi:DNA primase